MMLCQDSDLLYFDPLIFTSSAGQIVASISGTLTGTVISSPNDISDFDLQINQVAAISGALAAQFPIIAFTSHSVTISSLSAGFAPDDGSLGTPVNPFIESGGVAVIVRTFWPYRRTISDQLLAAAGIPILPLGGVVPTLLNPQDFKRAACLGTIAMAYNYLAANYASSPTGALYLDRYQIYVPLYTQAMRGIRAELDWNNDGKPDEIRYLGEIAMRRM